MIKKQCVCGNEFEVLPYRVNTAKYCSKSCTSTYTSRNPMSNEIKEKIRMTNTQNPKLIKVGKEYYHHLQKYYETHKNNMEYLKHQKKELHPNWTGGKCIEKKCLTCNISFKVHPYRKETANFCSFKCLHSSRKGVSAWNKGIKNPYNQETINKMRNKALNRVVKKFDCTTIENMVYGELLKRNLVGYFDRSKSMFNKFRADLVSEKFKIIVECDGDYWHANPEFMKGKDLNDIQLKKVKKDIEIKELADKNNYLLLRFWETDIKKDISGIGDFIQNCCNRGLAIVV